MVGCGCGSHYVISGMFGWEGGLAGGTSMKKVLIVECVESGFSEQFEAEVPYHWEERELDLGYSLDAILSKCK